jgi:hypothetical protein
LVEKIVPGGEPGISGAPGQEAGEYNQQNDQQSHDHKQAVTGLVTPAE